MTRLVQLLVVGSFLAMPAVLARADEVGDGKEPPKPAAKKPRSPGPVQVPRFQYHILPAGDAETVAKALRDFYEKDADVRINASGPRRLFVYATPRVQIEITTAINNILSK